MEILKVETSTNSNNKKQAIFIMAYAETDIWRNYDDVSKEAQKTIVPLVLMLQRWDGKIGFVGGNVDPGEDLISAAVREFAEESGYNLSSDQIKKLDFVCSHETENMVTHLMTLKVTEYVLRDIIINSHKAKHFMSEGTLFTTHMINYPHMKSFDNFMQNNFPETVKEQIMEAVTKLSWQEKYNL
jgi:U8 snoRNA-decapping enzyme